MKPRHLVFRGVQNIINNPTWSIIYQAQIPLARNEANKTKQNHNLLPSCCYTSSKRVSIRYLLTETVWIENTCAWLLTKREIKIAGHRQVHFMLVYGPGCSGGPYVNT